MYVFFVTSMHIVIYSLRSSYQTAHAIFNYRVICLISKMKSQPLAEKLSLQQDTNGDMKGGNTHPRSHGLDGGGGTYCKSP